MRKYTLPITALLAVVSVALFSSPVQQNEYRLYPQDAPSRYAFYDGSGEQDSLDNYPKIEHMPTSLPTGTCFGNTSLCYFRIDDMDHDGDIGGDDFRACFYGLDTGGETWGNRTLDDELEIVERLEKKF